MHDFSHLILIFARMPSQATQVFATENLKFVVDDIDLSEEDLAQIEAIERQALAAQSENRTSSQNDVALCLRLKVYVIEYHGESILLRCKRILLDSLPQSDWTPLAQEVWVELTDEW